MKSQVTDPYERLVRHIRNWLFGLPDSGILRKLIKTRFTPEEAEFLSRFPHRPATLDQLCEHLQMTTDELLITMAPVIKKGFVCEFESSKSGTVHLHGSNIFLLQDAGMEG